VQLELKVRVLRKEAYRVELEVDGEDHSFLNILVKTLLKDPSVKFAAYRIDHPLTGKPVVVVETNGGKDPFDALTEASAKVKELAKEFREAFEKSLEEYGS